MTKKSLIYVVFVLLVAFLLNLYPVDIEGLKAVRQANKTLKDGQSSAALNQYMAILSHSPEKMFLYQKAGEAAFLVGEFELAKHYLEQARNYNELDGNGLLILGDIYQQDGNWREAISVWKMIDLNKRNVSFVSIRLINEFVRQSMWSDAEQTLKTHLGIVPYDGYSSEMLGWIEVFIEPGKARSIFYDLSEGRNNIYQDIYNLIDKYPGTEEDADQEGIWWLEIGDLAVKKGHHDIALKAFEKSTEINGKFAVGWVKIALQKQSMKMNVDNEIKLAEKYGKNDSIVNAMLAEYWYIEKKPELSIIYLHKALEIDPNSQYNSLRLSQILSEIGNINEGLKYIKNSALQLNTADSWKSVIVYCLENGIYIQDEALPAARKALGLEPDSPEILDLAGQVFVALEDDITAERYFNQAIMKENIYYLAHLHLGTLYARIGATEKARNHLTIAAQQREDLSISEQAKKIISTIQAE
jgi:tetratricopeptide (TPR) repeat protein